jgi:type IV conjugative transfer system coupling protein TraD
MIKQVMTVGFVLSFLVGLSFFAWKITSAVPMYVLQQYVVSYKTECVLGFKPSSQHHLYVVSWPTQGATESVRGIDLMRHRYTHHMRHVVNQTMKMHLSDAFIGFLASFLALALFWALKGKMSFTSKRLRGQRLTTSFWLRALILFKRKASDLTVEHVPLIKNAEVNHILGVGTTGSGKTNLFNEILPQIARRQNKTIVIDTTGDMIAKYYNPDRGDIIINPFDNRTYTWDILAECSQECQFDSLASSIIPQNNEHADPLWRNGSAKLFSVGLQQAKANGLSPQDLHHILVQSPLKEFGEFFRGTDAFPFADPAGERTTLSFRSTLSSSVQFLKYLNPQKKSFSLSSWIQDEGAKNWIFLTANEYMLATLNPLIAAFFNSATTQLMSLPESQTRRLWFVMDELPAVQKLQALQSILSKGRKYGACIFAGIQSMSQFESVYGHHGSKTILNLFNTKFFFRCEEIQTCEQISKWLGEEEIEESRESLSYGAHQMRDGISLNNQKSIRRLVLPTEVAQLPNLTCFLKFPGKLPITKLEMTFNEVPNKYHSFQVTL